MNSSKKNIIQEWVTHFKERKEWKGIIEVASTSWVYVNPISMDVLKYIYKVIQKEPEAYFDSHEVFQKKSKIQLSLKEWRNASSEINKACVFFVKLKLLDKNIIASELDLQQYFLEARMWKNLYAQRNRNQKTLDNYSVKDASSGYYLAKFHELDLLDVRNKNNRKKLLNLDDFEQGIELYYHENKLRILCEKAARFSYQNTDSLSESEREWSSRIPKNIRGFPQIELFILSYKMILEQCDKTFNIIEGILNSSLENDNISKAYLQNFYGYLLLHSIYQMNLENYIYAEKYVDICNLMLKEDFGDENSYLPAWRFKNIIKSAAKMLLVKGVDKNKVFQRIENFVSQNQDKLIPESKDAIIAYAKAYILYLKKDFKKAEIILSRTNLSKDELIKLDTLFLYLFILLENQETDHFLRVRDNIREMLYNKDKVAKDIIKKYHKAISWVSKVQKLPNSDLKIFYQNKLSNIQMEKNFYGKNWLINYLERKV